MRVFRKNPKSRWNEMKEANEYYVTVAEDYCIPRGVMIYAENEEAAAKRAEMKIALQMRDAITVKAINVRDG